MPINDIANRYSATAIATATSSATTRRTSLSQSVVNYSAGTESSWQPATSRWPITGPSVTITTSTLTPPSPATALSDTSIGLEMTARLAASAERRARLAAASQAEGRAAAQTALEEQQARGAHFHAQQREIDALTPAEFAERRAQQQAAYRQNLERALRESGREEEVLSGRSLQVQQPRVPREPQHRVYLLNCKTCGVLLSNRGMKAVLLLRPHITLYSTDSLPANCRPLYPAGTRSTEPGVQRTCECLTQTLGCSGCSAQIGYMILAPCSRCTSSVTKHQRSSNGHRTVLHCSEITVRERRHVPGEAGVHALAKPVRAAPEFRDGPLNRNVDATFFDGASDSSSDLSVEELEAEKAEAALAHARAQADAMLEDLPPSRVTAASSASSPPAGKGRYIRRGECLLWSDLSFSGECTAPFDSDLILDMIA